MLKKILKNFLKFLLLLCLFIGGIFTGASMQREVNLQYTIQKCTRNEIILNLPYKGRVFLYYCTYLGELEQPIKKERS